VSEYGLRLQEKQKARHIYGIFEQQFRKYFLEAERRPGSAGENLLKMLEMRLDNVVYRLGFANSRPQARQLVRHGHITLNKRKVDIPSYQVKPGDIIAWKEESKKLPLYSEVAEEIESKTIPNWLSLDRETFSGQVLTTPSRNDIDVTIDERLIVEYYSR
jgi:small subunit ribosomal protein S4